MPVEEDQFPVWFQKRAIPILMTEFYISAGCAAQCMPCLKFMRLQAGQGEVIQYFEYEVKGKTATAKWADEML